MNGTAPERTVPNPMTNEEFEAWRKTYFKNQSDCADALGFGRGVVARLEKGKGRTDQEYAVPNHVALACAAYHLGVREYHGGPVTIAAK